MPFDQVTLIMPGGQRHGPVDWPTVRQWATEGRISPNMVLVDEATGEQRAAATFGDLTLTAPSPDDGAASTIIPFKNPPALLGYYLGIFSLISCIPFLGIIGVGMGIAAFILGLKGLKRVKENPACKGTAHAWIAIICGGLFGVVGLLINGGLFIAAITGNLK